MTHSKIFTIFTASIQFYKPTGQAIIGSFKLNIMNLLTALLCACPPSAALETIPLVDCIERFGEVQKVIVQRTKSGSTLNEITIATNDPALLATWNSLKSATDSTKVQVTPYIAEFANEETDPREASSEGVGGITAVLGDDFSPVQGYFHDVPQKVIKKIKKYNCEVGVSVFLINEHGQIGCIADDNESATKVRGIPTRSFFVGSKIMGGRNDVDKNKIMWKYLPSWSDEFYIINPTDFDPREEI